MGYSFSKKVYYSGDLAIFIDFSKDSSQIVIIMIKETIHFFLSINIIRHSFSHQN